MIAAVVRGHVLIVCHWFLLSLYWVTLPPLFIQGQLIRDNMLEYYKTKLSPRAFSQVANAVTDPLKSDFINTFIMPYLRTEDSCIATT
jgi:hypothetical protein